MVRTTPHNSCSASDHQIVSVDKDQTWHLKLRRARSGFYFHSSCFHIFGSVAKSTEIELSHSAVGIWESGLKAKCDG